MCVYIFFCFTSDLPCSSLPCNCKLRTWILMPKVFSCQRHPKFINHFNNSAGRVLMSPEITCCNVDHSGFEHSPAPPRAAPRPWLMPDAPRQDHAPGATPRDTQMRTVQLGQEANMSKPQKRWGNRITRPARSNPQKLHQRIHILRVTCKWCWTVFHSLEYLLILQVCFISNQHLLDITGGSEGRCLVCFTAVSKL